METTGMRAFTLALLILTCAVSPSLALKRVPYPEVRVTALPAFAGDPALADLRNRMADAVAAKKIDALIPLLSPKFEWTAGGAAVDEYDPKRDAEHNFKVALGFRPVGRDADGNTDIGPQWSLLEYFSTDSVLTQEKGSPLVCTSATAKIADFGVLDAAFNRIDDDNDLSEWVYVVGDLELTTDPAGASTAAKVSGVALPIVGLHPAPKEGAKTAPTHFELLLPSGKSGWASVNSVRPLFVDRLCFTKLGDAWKIAAYEQWE
jgi:hypothetical protein